MADSERTNPDIKVWQKILRLDHWEVRTEEISRDQVVFPDDIEEKDRFFTGVAYDKEILLAVITHDKPLTREEVVHELLHVKYPALVEDDINELTKTILNLCYEN